MEHKFKTTINCNNCIRTVTNFINEVEGIEQWEVDTQNPDKILTVKGDASAADIIAAVEDAGFDIEAVEV
ncbi:MAG: cation transporter [Saprospiraceae bacterium]